MRQILAILAIILLISAPVIAQEVEPDGIFTIKDTGWYCVGLAVGSRPPWIGLEIHQDYKFGNNVSGNGYLVETYFDFLAFSVAWALGEPVYTLGGARRIVGYRYTFMIMQPALGIGTFFSVAYGTRYAGRNVIVTLGIMYQWTP